MAKLNSIMVRELTQELFEEYPVWGWDDSNEYHCPVEITGRILPSDEGALFIKSTLQTSDGTVFSGYIFGPYSVFGFGIFYEGKEYLFNLNLVDFILKKQKLLATDVGREIELFPLKYETDFVRSDGQRVSGVIEL